MNAAIVAGLALIAAFIFLYIGLLPVALVSDDRRLGRTVLMAMCVTALIYFVADGSGVLLFITYICVAFVLLTPVRVSLPIVIVLSMAVVVLPQYVSSWDLHGLQWSVGAPAILTSLAMYGIRYNATNQIALFQARAEIEHLAAEQERLRIARDLHDLLGHALTTVVVKSELAAQLAGRDPERAATEMQEVAALARQSLADVRATVAGYREVSLVTELATAREVLRAAGIDAELPATTETVAGDLHELFGWVVREGVTNAVRHSRARHVRVKLIGERAIEVSDDGIGRRSANGSGSGLAGLTERVAARGGQVVTGNVDGGGFRLAVEVPA
jgi:two-component system sensor histidine kinase DesK